MKLVKSNKKDILDAWIMVEQLSEGNIKLKDNKKFKALCADELEQDDWYSFFCKKRDEWLKGCRTNIEEKISLIFYVDIFKFEDNILSVLREKYNLEKPIEGFQVGDKFGILLSFDRDFKLEEDKFFVNLLHYFCQKKELPKSIEFHEFEYQLKEEVKNWFDKNFDFGFNKLKQKYKIKTDNFRYSFVNNGKDIVNLHSFFINDLQKAKELQSANLDRYLFGLDVSNRKDLVTKNPTEENKYLLQEILKPENYPLGRFPSNPEHNLSLMQQVAVNLAIKEDKEDYISSVNGPPGTGKTTLLKDIFAEYVVRQAKAITDLEFKNLKGGIVYDYYTNNEEKKKATMAKLPTEICNYNMLVASSNNAAVQNIVNELPLLKDIDNKFKQDLLEVDYFEEIINKGTKNKNWGVFSLEGGKKTNLDKMKSTLYSMYNDLVNNYTSKTDCYKEFVALYSKVTSIRRSMQIYSEKLKERSRIKIEIDMYEADLKTINKCIESERKSLEDIKKKAENELIKKQRELDNEIKGFENKFQESKQEYNLLIGKIKTERTSLEKAKKGYKTTIKNKLFFLWFKRIFYKDKVAEYFRSLDKWEQEVADTQKNVNNFEEKRIDLKNTIESYKKEIEKLEQEKDDNQKGYEQYCRSQQLKLSEIEEKARGKEKLIIKQNKDLDEKDTELNIFLKQKIKIYFERELNVEELDFTKDYRSIQLFNPWFNDEFREMQSKLFMVALKVRKQFLYDNRGYLQKAILIWDKQDAHREKVNGNELIITAWQWINFSIPIISTTFSSFGRMFRNLGVDSISNLFIDEAGQALPQASVGAIFRSRKVVAVGDPAQIKPVWSLDDGILTIIGRIYSVGEKYLSQNTSAQSLIDATSKYGFYKKEDEWIGIPLWVHRRCKRPMFDIANKVSYNGLMVLGVPEEESKGKAEWYDKSGKADDKFVREQAIFLASEISDKLSEIKDSLGDNPEHKDERDQIYVISPFVNVANKLASNLKDFVKKDSNGKPINVGTVHTFQGKEAAVVYLVLGADEYSKGAANWAVSEPNIINVAATRAKKEFYVIGDKNLYANLTPYASDCLKIIDSYNKELFL